MGFSKFKVWMDQLITLRSYVVFFFFFFLKANVKFLVEVSGKYIGATLDIVFVSSLACKCLEVVLTS